MKLVNVALLSIVLTAGAYSTSMPAHAEEEAAEVAVEEVVEEQEPILIDDSGMFVEYSEEKVAPEVFPVKSVEPIEETSEGFSEDFSVLEVQPVYADIPKSLESDTEPLFMASSAAPKADSPKPTERAVAGSVASDNPDGPQSLPVPTIASENPDGPYDLPVPMVASINPEGPKGLPVPKVASDNPDGPKGLPLPMHRSSKAKGKASTFNTVGGLFRERTCKTDMKKCTPKL